MSPTTSAIIAVMALLCYSTAAVTFYLPSVEPISYHEGEEVDVRVNSLRSLSDIFPYDYYSLPFCKPSVLVAKPEILGEMVWGDKVQSSDYKGEMKKNVACKLLASPTGTCDVEKNNEEIQKNIDKLESYINKGYRGYMSIDNLPVWNNGSALFNGNCKGDVPLEQRYAFQRGYALGVNQGCIGKTLINNHLHFRIEVNQVEGVTPPQYRVVGFTAIPYSIRHRDDGGDCRDNPTFNPADADIRPLTTDDVRGKTKVWWSYGITWVDQPNVKWATRWDAYLRTSAADTQNTIHWLSIITSLVATSCLALIASIILLRTLHRDFNRYNNPIEGESNEEEVGWKLVHADVFRPPVRAQLLSALVGNGVQILTMFAGVMVFAMLGVLSPGARGALLTCIILLYVFMSFLAGYTCGRLLKYFDLQEWKHVFLCACAFPGTVCLFYLVSDIINAAHHASDAVPLLTLLTVLSLWLLISVPLTVLGASFAFHQLPIVNPVNIGKLAREIPAQKWMLQPWFLFLVCPLPSLFAVHVELTFILQTLWQGMVFYVFGFLSIVFVVWILTLALTTVIAVYYMLCNENHQWWWTSFIAPGGFGAHLLVFCTVYYHTQLDISAGAPTCLYFLYMGLLSLAYGVTAGAVGFIASLLFTRKIYGSIKID